MCQAPLEPVFSSFCPSPALTRSALLELHSSSAHVSAEGKGLNVNLSTPWHHSELARLILAVLFLSCRCLL